MIIIFLFHCILVLLLVLFVELGMWMAVELWNCIRDEIKGD